MPWETMGELSSSSGPWILSPLKLYVPSAFLLYAEAKFDQGELAHRALKAFYPLTSKIDTPSQLAKHKRRRRVLQWVAEVASFSSPGQPGANAPPPPASSDNHHSIATTQNNLVNLFAFLREHNSDTAIKVEVTFDFKGTLLMAFSEFHTKTEGPYPI
jgi:hypothetical protein